MQRSACSSSCRATKPTPARCAATAARPSAHSSASASNTTANSITRLSSDKGADAASLHRHLFTLQQPYRMPTTAVDSPHRRFALQPSRSVSGHLLQSLEGWRPAATPASTGIAQASSPPSCPAPPTLYAATAAHPAAQARCAQFHQERHG
jgi:hypothetical protein